MSATVIQPDQALRDAVARNAAAVLSLPSAGMIRNIKSRFLQETEQGIWLEVDPTAIRLTKELLETQSPLAVSFRVPPIRMSFLTKALRLEAEFQMNPQTTVIAVLVENAQEIKSGQRRIAYRVTLFDGCGLSARVWRIPDHVYLQDRPSAKQEIKIEVCDLSVGGMGIRFTDNSGAFAMEPEQRLRIQLIYRNEEELLLDGRVRGELRQASDDVITAGVGFRKLESDVAGRQKLATLTRIIGELQVEEVRRNKLMQDVA